MSTRPFSPTARTWLGLILAAAMLVPIRSGPAARPLKTIASPAEAKFLAANVAAMDRMMADMAITPSGDVDADFAAAMIPHHQGAIAMAEAELRFGRNEQLRRIAQEIIVDQQSEIAAMRLAVGSLPPPRASASHVQGSTASTPSRSEPHR